MKLNPLAGLLFSLCAAHAVQAQSNDPIRLTISYPAGASLDSMGRAYAEELRKREKTVVVVENKAGANGTIAAAAVAQAPADGRNFLLSGDTLFTVNPVLYTKSQFDINSLEALGVIAFQSSVLAVRADSPLKTVADLVAAGQDKEITYSSAGIGSSGHLMMTMLSQQKPIKGVHVPYRGGAPAVMGLMSGEVDVAFLAVGNLLPHIQTGKLRALAISGPERLDSLPDTPTMRESGFPDFAVRNSNLIFAPAGLNDEARNKAYQQLEEIRRSPAFTALLDKLGMEPATIPSSQIKQWIQDEGGLWADVIKQSGLKVE